MNSTSRRRLVFLDADVLAAPVTRSLVPFAWQKDGSMFQPVWSPAVESEADRALLDQWENRPSRWASPPMLVSELRCQAGWGDDVLVRDSTPDERAELADTSAKDRHVLAAACLAGSGLVVTGNVSDFGPEDLARLGVAVAHPDLFLAAVVSDEMYGGILRAIGAHRVRPPRTPEAIHISLGRSHPRLAAARRGVFPGVEVEPPENVPVEVFRGNRCVVCGKALSDPESLGLGVGPECRRR